ncbi:gamma-glutamylcyclotransferase family protein [Aspergillus vadensis CBS 113365]|uniref:Putative gamma-glutamylcyclotransferase n=1 Tax=Aspergillus vadensis (strain CBS 113365 / IMI 142717 / IBT 24658) TaxID=1448311 RepID=A0A319BIX6_ASPVC|nr:poly(A) polymerase pla1 [Aspergillus vadensis CBS 113365]PYH73136.1 poly(A) polymerase pla1 [Aspergillus vadensis CBS 113365]
MSPQVTKTAPPPPPPPPSDPRTKSSPVIRNLRTVPPRSLAVPQPPPPPTTTAPTGPYFLYGTLMDPSMLQDILSLDPDPKIDLRPAYVTGYACKLWGQYPAIIPAITSSSAVNGVVYRVESVEHGVKLASYETGWYRAEPCEVVYTDGKEPGREKGHVFVFVGDERELSEGVFDLRVWLGRMGGRGAVGEVG